MEAGFIVFVVLIALACVVVGVHIEKMRAKRKNEQAIQGVLNVICDESGGMPQLFLQLIVPVEEVMGQKQTIFDVNVIR